MFVGSRFLARPQRLHGSGYGTDDWTILHCLILLIPINVLVQTMTDNGLGKDNYQIPAPQITAFLQVSLYTVDLGDMSADVRKAILRLHDLIHSACYDHPDQHPSTLPQDLEGGCRWYMVSQDDLGSHLDPCHYIVCILHKSGLSMYTRGIRLELLGWTA